ncbi:MAG: hypothetical protein P9L94_07220 [Candidatus Hinthialibacter antarcticus]|nr:hypothetical protein [Candidatus Hinthialibacter antarcticus]
MCEKQEVGIVLAVLRQLVLLQGNLKQEKKDESSNSKTREMMVASSLDEFPLELIRRMRKYPHLVKTSGVWFAHLCAYCNANYMHGGDGVGIGEIVQSPTYGVLRDTLFGLMKKEGPAIDEDAIDTVLSIYKIEHASMDGRQVVKEMMLSLEKRGLIQIERPQGECIACGAEVPIGVEFCEDCRKDQKLAVMKAMQGAKPPSLLSPSQPKRSGMHVRKE